jgi:hypothetical protein
LQNLSFDAPLWRSGLAGQSATPIWSTLWATKPWTLWTSALVHLGPAHLWGNVAALAALALLGHQLRLPAAAVWAWLLAWPLLTLGLLLWPEITRYTGLSGLIHANVSVIWSFVAIKNRVKWLSFTLFAGMALKLLHERAWQSGVVFSPDWGFDVVVAAHLAGAVAGVTCGLPACLWVLALRASKAG